MKLIDANILINAFRKDAPDHDRYLAWLDSVSLSNDPFCLPDLVIVAFIRIATNPRIFKDPATIDEAVGFISFLLTRPHFHPLYPGPRHWPLFVSLTSHHPGGNLTNDAWLAALALEHNADLFSADRDFARFPALRFHHPLDSFP
jgi:toxin-antitoxin system PIN domain toxin